MTKRRIDKIAEMMIFLFIWAGTIFSSLFSLMFLLLAAYYFLFGADEQTPVNQAIVTGLLMLLGSIFFIIPSVFGVSSLIKRDKLTKSHGNLFQPPTTP